jgi:Prophage tail length tape measure protein
MAIEADRVVVALIGDTSGLDGPVAKAAVEFNRNMTVIEGSAVKAEKAIRTVAKAGGFQLSDLSQKSAAAGQSLERSLVPSANAAAFAARNLGFQIGDIGTQLSGGQSPFLIISQQGPQVAQALQEISASGAGLGQVLKTVALPGFLSILGILGPFVAQLLAGAGAASQKKDALRELIGAINDMVKSTDAAIASGSREISINQSAANALLSRAQATRELTKAQIQSQIATVSAAQATERQSGGTVPGAGLIGRGAASQEATLATLRRQLAVAEQGEARAQLAVRNAQTRSAQQRVRERTDPTAAAQGRFDRGLDNLNNLRQAGVLSVKQYESELTKLTETQKRETAAATASGKATGARTASSRSSATVVRTEARELDQLRNKLESVERQYDPASAATREFATDLATIAQAMNRGIITPARAAELQLKAVEARMQSWLSTVQGAKDTLGTDQIFGNTADRIDTGRQRDAERAEQESQRRAEENIRDLADVYETLFTGGTASLWDDFKRQGLRALALIAAQKTFALLTGGSAGVEAGGGGLFGNAIGSLFGGGKDFTTGVGKGDVLGLGGIFGSSSSGIVAGDDTLGQILNPKNPFGGLGGLFGGLFGRASGGYVGPGQTVRVNESRGGVELLRMGSQGGTVIPLGRTDAARPQASSTVVNAPQFNMKGAVVTRELFAEMQRISQQSAAQASAAMGKQVLQAVPGRLSQYQNDGT